VDEVLYPLWAVAAWAAAGYRLWGLRADRHNPALLPTGAAQVFLAMIGTFGTPAVARFLDGVVGVPNVTILAAHLSAVLLSAAIVRLLLFWSFPPAEARRKARRLTPAFALILPALVVLFLLADLKETTSSLAGRYGSDPWVAEYLLLYLGTLAVALTAVAWLCRQYARIAARPWLRRGLRVWAAGAVVGILFCACKGGYVLALRLGSDPWYLEAATPVIATSAALLNACAFTMPALGPRLDQLRSWLGRHRAYHQLGPLWTELYRAVPEIALEPPRAFGLHPARDLDFWLYRRVIEIRDAWLALRPYLDDTVADVARRLGRAAGLSGAELDAVVEASVLAAALRAKERERPAAVSAREVPGGSDLCGELTWLVPVASAFARSSVVRAVLTAVGNADGSPPTPPAPPALRRTGVVPLR